LPGKPKAGLIVDDFRRLALSMPEAEEKSHMGHPDFRVNNKIFATLQPDGRTGMVALNPERQREFVTENDAVFSPVPGGWGEKGATLVRLEAAGEEIVERALAAAYRLKTAVRPRKPASRKRL